MLFFSLILSAVLLRVSFAARQSPHPIRKTLRWAAGVSFIPILWCAFFPAVWLQSAVLCLGLWIAAGFGREVRYLRPLSVAAVVTAYAVVGFHAMQQERERTGLRERFAFESMEDRLPRAVPPSSAGDPAVLSRLEQDLEHKSKWRSFELQRLHEQQVTNFVNSPGFGAARMVPPPSARVISGELRPDAPEQPDSDYFKGPLKNPIGMFARPDWADLGKLHQEGFLDFVNPKGFGYVKDRQHVAGFLSHGFSKVPEPAGAWKVARLELVGLLRHEGPIVYVSDKLPKMDDLKDAKTRPLDAFETAALTALRNGADLHTDDAPGEVRFLGAIRSTMQCLDCHGGERGALLGAFTYRLRPGGTAR